MNNTVVIALGGNALIKNGEKGNIYEQFANTRRSLEPIIYLIKKGYKIVITHGNGPQAGYELIKNEMAEGKIPPLPLGIIDASTQGSIGYMIEQSLQNKLLKEKISKDVVTIVTQVLVDKNDPSISNPTKPVGPFYSKDDLPKLKEKGWVIKEDAGRGYRRVVASPIPLEIIEKNVIINALMNDTIVIAAGGGGIPVYKEENGILEGFDSVIDKDRASAVLARDINADTFIILTSVDKVSLNFNKPNQKDLDKITLEEARKYLSEGHFSSGSMGPKIEAAITFLLDGGKRVIISSIENGVKALEGKTGTLITY
ncbi:carbamate kinase [candidate division TA06 bacterium]|uniref:Carbamate kinase n=1 Tax=candidate division TA06 bacterium TaxID=2250710 RepID=A0A660SNL8_UNCT6|nr:MAG: carbamate kinase [candidate division TA06 bacterium]